MLLPVIENVTRQRYLDAASTAVENELPSGVVPQFQFKWVGINVELLQ
jgi:hypothetical protein